MKRNQIPRSGSDVVNDMFSATVMFEGREISAREAWLRALYNESLGGNVDSARELQRLRKRCGVQDGRIVGCLLLPEPMSDEEWERECAEQQAPYREKDYGNDFD